MGSKTRRAFLIVIALQVLALLAFVGVREFTLRSGREVLLRTAPVDPRDLFRGDYVVLRYQISTVQTGFRAFEVGSTVYVSLAEGDGGWEATGVNSEAPTESGLLFIRGQVTRETQPMPGTRQIEVAYGIESYFVPEGTGRAIEQSRDKLAVKVMIDGFGSAAIKDLVFE